MQLTCPQCSKPFVAESSAGSTLCPHCGKKLEEVHWRQIEAVNAEYLFICPKCKKVIGVGVRKAAWIN